MADINNNFPSDLASNTEKDSDAFGLQVAEKIGSEWLDGNLSTRRMWISLMRSYSRGEQDVSQYKDTIEGKRAKDNAAGGSVKTHKIDYKTLKIMPIFKNIITNAIDESLFKPRAESIDITAVNRKRDYFKKIENNFYTRDFANIISQGLGINIQGDDVPQNEEELQIKKIEYKPRIEIAQELAIENVLKLERFETIKDSVDADLFDLGIGVLRHWTDNTQGIKLEYVDPYNYIHNDFEMDDGRDIRYHGVMVQGTIADVEKESGRKLTQTELDEIKKYSLEYNGIRETFVPYNRDMDSGRTLEYLAFAYLTRKERVYKKIRKEGKTTRLIDRSKSEDGYNPANAKKKMEIPYKVWYEGIYIPNAKVLTKWEEMPNQVQKDLENPISPFIVSAPNVKKLSEKGSVRFDSLINRCIPIVDDMHRDWFKFQQLKMELRPNTIEIDTEAINDVTLNGDIINANDLLDLFFGRGLLLKRRFNEDGDEIEKAINEKDGGVSNSAVVFLSNEFTNNYNRLRQFLGINELRDGTTQPNSKTAVTVQKLLLASSNNATNHIVKASFGLSLRMCEGISYRLTDVLKTEGLKERLIDAIGSSNVDLLDEIKNIPMHQFAIYFDFRPDNDERIAFEQSLINSENKGEINSAQYNQARQVRNVKSAIKFLEFSIGENEKAKQKATLKNIEAQAEANARTSVVAEQAKQQTTAQETEAQMMILREKDRLDEQKSRRDAMTKELLAQQQHQRELELKSMEVNIKRSVEGFKEDRKDDRVNLQDTNESKKIFQRKNNTAPIDFNQQLNSIFSNN